jgi:hypothetical protein
VGRNGAVHLDRVVPVEPQLVAVALEKAEHALAFGAPGAVGFGRANGEFGRRLVDGEADRAE